MSDALFEMLKEILRETYEGGLAGQGTAYLDHASGIRNTLRPLTTARASMRPDGHPSIAAHARHMAFHLRVATEWVQGVRIKRDWLGSFEPQTVSDEEWARIQQELEDARTEYLRVMAALGPDRFVQEGAGIDVVAHLAYHLGAIRQLVHVVRDGDG